MTEDEPIAPDPDTPVLLPVTDVLDLHAFHPRQIPEVVADYLDEAAARGLQEVRLIHGKGIGFQRERVRQVLATHPRVEWFTPIRQAIGPLAVASRLPGMTPASMAGSGRDFKPPGTPLSGLPGSGGPFRAIETAGLPRRLRIRDVLRPSRPVGDSRSVVTRGVIGARDRGEGIRPVSRRQSRGRLPRAGVSPVAHAGPPAVPSKGGATLRQPEPEGWSGTAGGREGRGYGRQLEVPEDLLHHVGVGEERRPRHPRR